MLPTLEDGQRLIVEKVSYRFRDPLPGEIVVLNVPNAQYIKRVIAVGGDIIEARGDKYLSMEFALMSRMFQRPPIQISGRLWFLKATFG